MQQPTTAELVDNEVELYHVNQYGESYFEPYEDAINFDEPLIPFVNVRGK